MVVLLVPLVLLGIGATLAGTAWLEDLITVDEPPRSTRQL
jgi:hypothetical protein